MNNFQFYNPTRIIFGRETIPTIGKEISRYNIKKVLLLAGSGSIKRNGVFASVTESLRKEGIAFVEKWGVHANPELTHAKETIELARKEGVEAIIALGGGSVIDEAKSVAVGFYLDDLWQAFKRMVPIEKALPIFTVLTISGTGSEMNQNAVLTNDKEQRKWAIYSPLIYPKFSIIDPSVQSTLPWHQTVNGAIDAMAHTLEFYTVGRNEEATLALDESLLQTIIKSVDALKKDESDYSARASIAWAATLALNGISGAGLNGGEWACHRIEHGISALKPEVAHGAGLAVVIPAWIRYVREKNPVLFLRWAKNIWQTDSVEEAIERMKAKQKSWGAPVTMTELGVAKSEIPAIAENALTVGNIGVLDNLGKDEIVKILESAL
jgi:alcohol dehydrogenase YqhD (iron-dependent ADH family)